jgi:choline dehydrogenase-like flavoprotein
MAGMAGRDDQRDDFDYVIVGGGSAGCVLANRLSADLTTQVLLIEAGGWDKNIAVKIPAGMKKLPEHYDWQFKGLPDPSRNGRIDEYAAGKVLGGGSTVNMMLWVRGERSDFDGWRDLGCRGWGYDDVLPYFEKCETFENGPAPARGTSGPVGVARFDVPVQAVDDFINAAVQAGHQRNPDYNGERQQGVTLTQVSQRNGLRSSTARAYLAPARKRANLTIRTEAFATRVVFEGDRAVGVEYQHDGHTRVARAAREVILSAGALVTPKLLMLSGIGPADHLREHGIEVKLDRGDVGNNLQDHAYGLMMVTTRSGTLVEELRPLKMLKHGLNYLFRRKGALTVGGGAALVFSQLAGEYPTECEIILMPVGMEFQNREGEASHEHNVHKVKVLPHSMMVFPSFVHPKGRGTVRLGSADPAEQPVFDHQLLTDADMTQLIAACRQAREIINAPAMKDNGAVEVVPGERVQSDEEWAAFLRMTSFRPYHPVGTCRMGADDAAVVDPQLRVRGVQGLRVVDASVFPTVTSGNTNAPVVMVAEKAADLILGAT